MLYVHGALSVNAYASWSVALRPSVLRTVTSTTPAGCAGLVAVIRLALLTTTWLADDPPKPTVAPAAKFDPLIVTDVPPSSSPDVGLSEVMVGVPDPLIGQTMPSIRGRLLMHGARPPATFCDPCSL